MADIIKRQPEVVTRLFDSVGSANKSGASTVDILDDSGISLPAVVSALLERIKRKVVVAGREEDAHAAILDSVAAGIEAYKNAHGHAPAGDVVEAVLFAAYNDTLPLSDSWAGYRFDSATSAHHDQYSLHPSNVMVSILQMLGEMIPWAAYLPTDAKSNEARLAIVTPIAKSNFGDYQDGNPMNGIAGGGAFMMSQRLVNLSTNGGGGTAITGTVTAQAAGLGTGGNTGLSLLRGRSVILVNGLPAAREPNGITGSGASTIAGSITIAATTYTIAGTVNTDTGAYSITSAPALPAGVRIDLKVFADFERAPQLTPKMAMQADVYQLFASPSRVLVSNSIDAFTQMQLELSVDARGQALSAVRSQFNQERHYAALFLIKLLAASIADTFDYKWSTRQDQMNRSQIWNDLLPVIAGISQRVANATTDHGITHLYMTGELAAQVRGLPSDLWQSSGITDRPGIYRMGRLANLYEVYYTPIGLTETGGGATSQILCIGKSNDTARNPLVMGDAVSPIFLPLAMGQDMVYQDGFYTRAFTDQNPHQASAQGAGLINVTNIK